MRKKLSWVVSSIVLVVALLTVLAGCSSTVKNSSSGEKTESKARAETIILATTTSTKDTGLLDVLTPAFEKKTGIKVKVIAVGSGEAVKMGERGEADVLLVHSKRAEEKFMADGYGETRRPVMHNDFVLVGPADDPAGIKGLISAKEAFKKIAEAQANFVTRGDDSGTHKKELSIWEGAAIAPNGDWYIKTGSGMAASLRVASEKKAYTVSDRGTWLVQKDNLELELLVEKDKPLLNPYSVITLNSKKFKNSRIKFEAGKAFADWIVSAEAQTTINEFGKEKYKEALFVGDAVPATQKGL